MTPHEENQMREAFKEMRKTSREIELEKENATLRKWIKRQAKQKHDTRDISEPWLV